MKKTLFFGLIAASLGFTACNKDILGENTQAEEGMVLNATLEQPAESRATIDGSADSWKFAFAEGDEIKANNTEHPGYYSFTNNGTEFKSTDARPTEGAASWYAYFPSNSIDLTGQDGTLAGVANLYALAGATPSATTGADGLTIPMSSKVAILKIDNQKGDMDIQVKSSATDFVTGLSANAAGFDVTTSTTAASLFSTSATGSYYVVVPAGIQISIKNGSTTIKSTGTSGLVGGKYYELTVPKPITGITLSPTTATVEIGKTATLTVTITPSNATVREVTWSSNNTGVATVSSSSVTVDASGKATITVTGVAAGSATVTATADGKSATCAVTVKAPLPAGALKGQFSVSSTKKVNFSKGNLYWNGSSYQFEANQYDYSGLRYQSNYVQRFFYSKNDAVARAEKYSESNTKTTDIFFTNSAETTVNVNFTVNGVQGRYRILSTSEWEYLLNQRTASTVNRVANARYAKAIVNQKRGLIILPDVYTHPSGVSQLQHINVATQTYGTGMDNKITTADWAKMEAAGAVFLPCAGYRTSTNVGDDGHYQASTPNSSNKDQSYRVCFTSAGLEASSNAARNYGFSVRLVTDN